MIIRKLKWDLFTIIDENGREVAVASSFREAHRLLKKLLANRTNKINNKK